MNPIKMVTGVEVASPAHKDNIINGRYHQQPTQRNDKINDSPISSRSSTS